MAKDRATVQGIPCTTVARTLLDLAGAIPPFELRKVISEAEVQRLLDLAAVRELIGHNRGRRGVAVLRRLISEIDPRFGLPRSELELRFLRLCRKSGLPAPMVNLPIVLADGEIVADFAWPENRLIVEADGQRFHGTSSAFERDRRRDQRLAVAGWRVVRCTWRQVVTEPSELRETLQALIRRRA
jgi:hypothetical protein